ncbi:DUF664 domain-containing protein [Rhodococcus hoagii]|nr:DUF664 domain-containing protein [Prescottella equi]
MRRTHAHPQRAAPARGDRLDRRRPRPTPAGTTRGDTARTASATWMLLHIVRELSQHLGQLEITRDVLSTDR